MNAASGSAHPPERRRGVTWAVPLERLRVQMNPRILDLLFFSGKRIFGRFLL